MRTESTLAFLGESRPTASDVSSEVSSEVGERGDAAYLRIVSASDPERWAVVWSPGDRWFSLDVNGGYSLNHFEEGASDSEVQRILREYTELALRYLREGGTPVSSRRLRLPGLKVSASEGDVVLRRSLATDLKSLFRLRRIQ